MENHALETFKDLSIKNKRNEIINTMMKMDLVLQKVFPNNINYREVQNYVYNFEDEDDFLNDAYEAIYNLNENFLDYIYEQNKK